MKSTTYALIAVARLRHLPPARTLVTCGGLLASVIAGLPLMHLFHGHEGMEIINIRK
jgi:hypothetical protein